MYIHNVQMTCKIHLNICLKQTKKNKKQSINATGILSIGVCHTEVDEAEVEEVAVVENDELEELLADARRWVPSNLGDLGHSRRDDANLQLCFLNLVGFYTWQFHIR